MKSIITLIALIVVTSYSYGQRVVALHSTGTQTMFSAVNPFVDAYNAAVAGDTIYVPGGSFACPTTLNKDITIIGAGIHPDSTTATIYSAFSNGFTLGDNADNIHIEGMVIPSLDFTNHVATNGFLFRRCLINSPVNVPGNLSTPCTGGAFIGNIFTGTLNLNNLTNSLLSNNQIQGLIYNSSSNNFDNNIIISTGGGFNYIFHNCSNNTISNNVVTNPNVFFIAGSGNVSQYNLFENSTPIFGTTPIVIGNYLGVPHADIFVSQSGGVLNFTDDYHLVHPTTYLGSDATQVGIYGGSFPFKEGAVPMNPHIRSATIAPTTNAIGELSIDIVVGAQNE